MAFSMLAPRWSFCSSPLRESCLRANRRSFAVQAAQAAHRQIDPVGRGRRSWNGLASLATLAGLSGSGLQVRNLVSRMARAKASKAKSRSQDLNVSKCHRCFEGTVFRCNHYSEALGLDACFSVYVPDAPRMQTTLPYPRDCEEFPVLLFLSDEGCSDIEVLMQGGLLEHCAACGLIRSQLTHHLAQRAPRMCSVEAVTMSMRQKSPGTLIAECATTLRVSC